MSMEVVSLVALVVAILMGFFLKVNVGIISIAFAYLIGLVYGVPAGKIIGGFSSSMAITMIGVMYLFGIITKNGTLEVLARKITGLAGNRRFLLYIAMYVIGGLLSGVGPGAIPTLAIVPVLAIPVALKAGMNPILLSLIGQMGAQSFRMSPITPEAVVVSELMVDQGLDGNTVPAMWCLFVTEVAMIAASFVFFKGWKFSEPAENLKSEETPKFSAKQLISLAALIAMIVSVVAFGCNVGLASFVAGTVLVILKCGEDGMAIKSMPWNTILLVLGVGVLMNVVKLAGGVDLLASLIASFATRRTASPLMCLVSGFMSFLASGLGVVFPTLIPTVGSVAQDLNGLNPAELMSAVVIGGTVTGFSPISTAGALILAGVAQFEGIGEKYSQNKMFVELFVVAVMAMVISTAFAALGVYSMICG
ncbi:SLC13 family permease [Brotaphodocola sp.]|uniref:SLC13 family permease n=1 Tax=Brotaphodocola sp. TaxID=3073577 RepID=UPI003D7E2813